MSDDVRELELLAEHLKLQSMHGDAIARLRLLRAALDTKEELNRSLAAQVERLKTERDAMRRRAEAAESDWQECEHHIERLKTQLSDATRDNRDELFKEFLHLRGIETPCKHCGGMGVYTYGNTSTWRHGIGGQTMTLGICDQCWGSGNARWTWLNLRETASQVSDAVSAERKRCREQEVRPLATAIGDIVRMAGSASTAGVTVRISDRACDRLFAVEKIQKENP